MSLSCNARPVHDELTTFPAPGPRRAAGEPIPPRPAAPAADRLDAALLVVRSPVASGLAALGDWLIDAHYGHEATERIIGYVEREGTVTGAPGLDAEDEWAATEVYVAGLAEVPAESKRWDDETVCIDVELYLNGVHPTPFPEPPAGLPDLAAFGLAPIAGGSPEGDEPCEPSAEEWAAACAMFREAEGCRAAQACAALDVRRLEAVGRALYGDGITAAL